jgi:hypothetical protein
LKPKLTSNLRFYLSLLLTGMYTTQDRLPSKETL